MDKRIDNGYAHAKPSFFGKPNNYSSRRWPDPAAEISYAPAVEAARRRSHCAPIQAITHSPAATSAQKYQGGNFAHFLLTGPASLLALGRGLSRAGDDWQRRHRERPAATGRRAVPRMFFDSL